MMTFTSKIGSPRGVHRIWIEGKRLAASDWIAKQTTYDKHWTDDGLLLKKSKYGRFQVSGKGDHPIIDITSKQVSETFVDKGFERVRVDVNKRQIAITGERANQ